MAPFVGYVRIEEAADPNLKVVPEILYVGQNRIELLHRRVRDVRRRELLRRGPVSEDELDGLPQISE